MTESPADPFGTANLRRAVLAAWSGSPARFREDANAEESLSLTGYADRVVVELAANAADAAIQAGVPGRLRLRVVDNELRAANTGAPLTSAGVAALASLRASAKRENDGGVGHFGVGFTAVLAVTDQPRIISSTGGVEFSARKTADAIAELASADLDAEIVAREGQLPILRLAWPATDVDGPPAGFTTEVRLPLKPGIDVNAVLAAVGDYLLLALPGLESIELPGRTLRRVVVNESGEPDPIEVLEIINGQQVSTWWVLTRSGMAGAELLADRPMEERQRPGWRLSWAYPDSAPAHSTLGDLAASYPEPGISSLGDDVVYSPTPTDELLGLPARLIGSFPVDDTRRRLAKGALTDYLLGESVRGYLDLVLATPIPRRLQLIPAAGFGLGPIDAKLRADILDALRGHPFLVTASGRPITPEQAAVLPGASERLCELVGEAVPELTPPVGANHLSALRSVGVTTLELHEVSRLMGNLDRPIEFWAELYSELAQYSGTGSLAEELADLPVPLADGRTVLGARGCLVAEWGAVDDSLVSRITAAVPGLRLIHPGVAGSAAARNLMIRLGAAPADLDAVLADAAVVGEMTSLRTDLDDGDAEQEQVESFGMLILDVMAAGGRLPAELRELLVLTDIDGEPWPATQLLAHDSPLAPLLAQDADLPAVNDMWAAKYPPQLLREAGVMHGFRLVHDPVATGPDHDLPDEDEWWETVTAAAVDFWAVADLDLVADDSWPAAMELLDNDPNLLPHLRSEGYTRWWLSRYALLADRPPRHWRLPSATELTGLYDELPLELPEATAQMAGVRSNLSEVLVDDLQEAVDRFADPRRSVAPGQVSRLTAALASALATRSDQSGRQAQIDLPSGVRTLSGTVESADEVVVLDRPWFAQAVPLHRAVPGGLEPEQVADSFELPLASAVGGYRLQSAGSVKSMLAASAPRDEALKQLGWFVGEVSVWVAEKLTVISGSNRADVSWWSDENGLWVDGSTAGWARCLSYLADRWAERHLADAMLAGRRWELGE